MRSSSGRVLLVLTVVLSACTGGSDGPAFAAEYREQLTAFQAEFDRSGRVFEREIGLGNWREAAGAADDAVAAVDRLIGWQRSAKVPTSSADVVKKLECEKGGAEQLRTALSELRTATLTIDISAFTRADARVKEAIVALDACAGVQSNIAFARRIQVATASPTPTPRNEELRELARFAESYKLERWLDRETRLAIATRFPSPDPDQRRHAQAMAAWCEGFNLIPRSYDRLPRSPVTRSFVDRATEVDALQRQADRACSDFWQALAEGRTAQADSLSARKDELSVAVKRGWTDLEDRIDDALRAHGSSWETVGGRP